MITLPHPLEATASAQHNGLTFYIPENDDFSNNTSHIPKEGKTV